MVKLAVFASGNGGNFEALVKEQSNYQVVLLIVDQKQAFAQERAERLGVKSIFISPLDYESKLLFEKAIIEILKEHEIEYIALAGYMRIISFSLLQAYSKKIINIHPAYLPEFPGKDGIGDAFRAKSTQTGITIHYVDEGIDTGEIIFQERIEIDPSWSLEELATKIHEHEHRAYPQVLKRLFERCE